MLEDRARINLSNLDGGALQELFEAKLPQILDNIRDPNTRPETQRVITVTIKIKPTKSRKEAELIYGITTKLAAANERSTTVFLSKDAGTGEPCLKEYPQDKDIEEAIAESKAKAREEMADAEDPPAEGGKVLNIGQRS